MKIVKLKGGLGNQMFQYAYAKLLDSLSEEEVKLDYSAYKSTNKDTVRVPRITKFNISLGSCSEDELNQINYFKHKGVYSSLKYKVSIWLESKLNKKYYFAPREYIDPNATLQYSYFDGYWQNIGYIEPIKDSILAEFVPKDRISEKTEKMIRLVEEQNSVFIGVRKGDYTAEKKHYGSFDSTYYQKAMAYISERVDNPIFYVFSNDIEWCKKNLEWGDFEVVYRETDQQTSDFEELILMTHFKHAIIINSTYHWWGAYLIKNHEKIVCCPEKWFFDNCHIDIYPEEWVKIDSM